jgi:hypothetical protein
LPTLGPYAVLHYPLRLRKKSLLILVVKKRFFTSERPGSHRILAGTSAVTPEMAVRLGKFCGNGAGLWLRMQEAFDLWHAERRLAKELDRIPAHTPA